MPALATKPASLFHLAADLSETKDLAAAEPEKVKELKAIWDQWNARAGGAALAAQSSGEEGKEQGEKQGEGEGAIGLRGRD